MRGKWWLVLFILCISALVTGVASARDILQGDSCTVEADEIIQGNVFVLCRELLVEGEIQGNLIGIAIQAQIYGEVQGNLYLVSAQLELAGAVERDVYFAGATLDVLPIQNPDDESDESISPINGHLINATLSTTLHEGTHVPGTIIDVGYQLVLNGGVDGEISFWGSALVINGRVDDDIYATVGNPSSDGSQIETLLLPLNLNVNLLRPGLTVREDAIITGQLDYTGPAEGDIQGNLTFNPIYTSSDPIIIPIPTEEAGFSSYISQVWREITTLFVIGAIGLIFSSPRVYTGSMQNLQIRPVSSFVVGMLGFLVAFPITLIIVLLSGLILFILAFLGLDGLLVATLMILGTLIVGGVGLFFFIAIYVSRIMVCLAAGKVLLRLTFFRNGNPVSPYLSLLVGVVFLAFLATLPVVGLLINATFLFLGLGTIMNGILEYAQRIRQSDYEEWILSTASNPPPEDTIYVRANDPKALMGANQGHFLPPGMTNLPAGFDMSFFGEDEEEG